MRRATALPLSALAATAAAVSLSCAATPASARLHSGVKGIVAPCGVVLERPAKCATDPGGALVTVHRAGQVVAAVKADARGRFRVRVRPGSYMVRARSKDAAATGLYVATTVPRRGWVSVVLPLGRTAPPRPITGD